MTNRWMAAKVTDGLFPNERTVDFPTEDGDVSVFVSNDQVEAGRLKVTVLEQDSNFALIQVPSQHGSTIAKIKRELLGDSA